MSRSTTIACFLALGLLFIGASSHAQGILLPSGDEGGPLELRSHEVEFRVDGQAAVTKVTHRFFNPANRPVEAMFYFPIPEGATTTDFALWMNGQRVAGSVLPRDEARRTYEQIVRRIQDPGLLEYVNGTLFQARIFPVPARGEQTVEIEYAGTLERDGNVVRYHYPVHSDASFVANNFIINGDIQSSGGIAQVYAPHYSIDSSRTSPNRFSVSAELSRARLTNDFEVFITSSSEDVALSVLSWDGSDGSEEGYFMLSLTPSEELTELRQLPREVTFAVDVSGSMAGEKMQQARELLEYCISELKPGDRFNIITFATSVDSLFDEIQPINESTKRDALRFIRNLDAAGGTNIDGAMQAAMALSSSGSHATSVFFVTDGLPTSGERNISNILSNVATAFDDDGRRLFAFGVGYDVNTRLLDGMARRGTGRSDYVRPGEDLRASIGGFFDSVSAPLLTDVNLDFGTAEVFRVYPEEPGVLYKGEELILFGRFQHETSTYVTLSGRAGNEPWSERYPAAFGEADTGGDRSFIGNLWASRRVADLLKDIDEGGENEEAVQSVVQLATRWNIVTPYTSYLAVDPSEVQPTPMPQPPVVMRGDRRSRASDDEGRALQAEAQAAPLGSAFGRSGGGSGGGRAQASQAPAPSRREMVERSVARNALEDADNMADSASTSGRPADVGRRTIEGRSFERHGQTWVQVGISATTDRRIEYLSDAYFEFLRAHPELRRVLALGDQLRLQVGTQVIEITPAR